MTRKTIPFASIALMALCSTLTAASLAPGTYNFGDAHGTMDAGWALSPQWGDGNYIYLYSYYNGINQQFTYTSNGELQSVTNTSAYFYDNGGYLALGPNGDPFSITQSGNGYTIKDLATGLYVNSPGAIDPFNYLTLTSTPTVWTVTSTAAPPPPPPTTTTVVDDTDSSIVYSVGNNLGPGGGAVVNWNYWNGISSDYMSDEHSGNFQRFSPGPFQGSSAAITFNGTGITWIGKKGPNYGMAAVSIDGGTPKTVDTYNPVELDQSVNYPVSGLSPGSHVLQISLLSTKNPRSSDYWETVDSFQINGKPLSHSSGTIVSYNALPLSGSWTCYGPLGTDLSGGHCWTGAANAGITWQFSGSLLEVFGRPDLENGFFNAYVDGVYIATVDTHFGNFDDDSLNEVMLFAWKGQSGTHTFQLVVTGTHDQYATNSLVQVDELVAFP